jgi:methylmalonyl-CoA mutase N-terminal domain/subunit
MVTKTEESERTTPSDIEIEPTYRPEDVEGIPYAGAIGDPGEAPFTRGLYPEMYRKRLWTMRQYAGYADASESNRRYRYLLEHGTTGLSVAFDLPTQIGYDSDHEMALGEVGRVGVAISSLDDMRRLFDRIPLDQVTTSMTINATASILLAFYLVVAEEQGVPWEQVGGTVQNDILKEYAARGTYIYPPGGFLSHLRSLRRYDEQEILHFSLTPFCLMNADAGHVDIKAARIWAGPAFPVPTAANPAPTRSICSADRHSATACAAVQQSREKPPWSALQTRRHR